MRLLRRWNKSLSTGRKRYTQTSTPNGLAIRQDLPHALCAEDQTVFHTLLRCNIDTLKRMHINRHHHAVSLCGEEISKGKLGSAIFTMDACNSEKLSGLNIEPPDDIERNIPDFFFWWCYSYGPQQGPDRQQKKKREGSSRGESKRKLLKETQNQGRETRKKKRIQEEY
jgi:hypothetical protein